MHEYIIGPEYRIWNEDINKSVYISKISAANSIMWKKALVLFLHATYRIATVILFGLQSFEQ